MKPDSKNPGSVESAVNAEALNVPDSKSELNDGSKSEVIQNDSPTSVSRPVVQNADVAPSNLGVSQNSQSSGGASHFENQIAQLPAEESDTIEQDWVDKVHEIELKAGNDPYHEDEAHHALSRAYLKKRFNVDVE
jgi:hypothetical protein